MYYINCTQLNVMRIYTHLTIILFFFSLQLDIAASLKNMTAVFKNWQEKGATEEQQRYIKETARFV